MRKRTVLQAAVGVASSLVFGYLAFRSVPLSELKTALRDAHYVWLIPALIALALALLIRSERWRCMFSDEEQRLVTFPVAFWTLSIGLCFNSLLPARAGEVARCVALTRATGIKMTQVVTATVVERIFDVVSLALLLLVSLILLPQTGLTTDLTILSAVLVSLFVALALALVFFRPSLKRGARRGLRRMPVVGGDKTEMTIASVGAGLRSVFRANHLVRVSGWSFASWLMLALSNWFVLRAFTSSVPWTAALFVLIATNLAMIIPSTAGSLGIFEAATRAALAVYSVPPATALSFGLVLHAINLLPFIPLGLIGLARLHLRSRDLRAAELDAVVDDPGATAQTQL